MASEKIAQWADTNKALVVFGPRQSGKTTLLKHYLQDKQNYLFLSGEDVHVQNSLSSQSIDELRKVVERYDLLVLDEAQAVPNIGLNLKLLHDHCPELKIIATGSSSFDLSQSVGETLTGRKITL